MVNSLTLPFARLLSWPWRQHRRLLLRQLLILLLPRCLLLHLFALCPPSLPCPSSPTPPAPTAFAAPSYHRWFLRCFLLRCFLISRACRWCLWWPRNVLLAPTVRNTPLGGIFITASPPICVKAQMVYYLFTTRFLARNGFGPGTFTSRCVDARTRRTCTHQTQQ